ncbi:hypothetical protein vseg_003372 [Gypsophila vaccaria]
MCLFLLFISSTPTYSLPYTLQLSHNTPKLQNPQAIDMLIYDLAKSTLARAYHLKNRPKNPVSTPLFPSSAGEYSISLSVGTPPQTIPAFFDTGSSLVWVPCTSNYSCSNCTTPKIPTFKPRLSSSKKHVNCHNTKCQWLDEPGSQFSCPNCNPTLPGNCTRPCSYVETYGSGVTSGKAIFETLHFQTDSIPGLFLGCSLKSEFMPAGLVGFGRNPMSLPSQLKVGQFSHCLVSHKFDDASKSSRLVLGKTGVVTGLFYTPLLKNPDTVPLNEYYYVQLEHITINNKIVKLPHKILNIDYSSGNGGTIVDSGSTFTSLASTLFDSVGDKYVTQLTPDLQKRVVIAASAVGNMVCVNVKGEKRVVFPEVVFHFKGGAKMDLPVVDYKDAGSGLLCVPFVNMTFDAGSAGTGPAIILGNYQQQNLYVVYDLVNERLGFKKQIC